MYACARVLITCPMLLPWCLTQMLSHVIYLVLGQSGTSPHCTNMSAPNAFLGVPDPVAGILSLLNTSLEPMINVFKNKPTVLNKESSPY